MGSSYELERLANEYKECLKDIERAKANQDNYSLKSNLLRASELLNRLADFYTGPSRDKAISDSRKMKEIAERIYVQPAQQRANAAPNNPYAYGNDVSPLISGNNNPGNGGANGEQESDNIDGLLTFIKPEEIDITFDDVIGLEKAKKAMEQYVIKPLKDPESYRYNYGNSKCIFLSGPPGTGKTTFAKAVAKEVGVPFAKVEVSGIVNCLVGETAKNIDKIFKFAHDYAAKYNTKLILFFDEFEEIARSRGSDDKTSSLAVPALLRNLEGMTNNKDLIVLAASNYVELIDKALFDRFRQIVEVPLPNKEAREFLFKNKFKEVEQEYLQFINFPEAAEKSEGLSGREITNIVSEVKYFISDCLSNKQPINENLQQYLLQQIEERKHLDNN